MNQQSPYPPRKHPVFSLIIPAYNEAESIEELLTRVHSVLNPFTSYESIVIDDRSSDDTFERVSRMQRTMPVRVFEKEGMRGKSYAIWEGLQRTDGPIVGFIDADLQYPPEALPRMISLIQSGATVVVANRMTREESGYRLAVSAAFRWIFGYLLHGLSVDVQSGMKVLSRVLVNTLDEPKSPWTFDLHCLLQARNIKGKIASVPIRFSARRHGISKVKMISSSIEIGLDAIRQKIINRKPVIKFSSQDPRGRFSLVYNGRKYHPNSNLPITESALHLFSDRQKMFIIISIGMVLLSAIINVYATIIVFLGLLMVLYLIDMAFSLYIMYRGFTQASEISISDTELQSVNGDTVPSYSILCPLYREWKLLPQFIDAVEKLNYPADKKQVLLLLEENDHKTIAQISRTSLPSYFDVIIVPHSLPKTKPKACNYGMQFATGDYTVIYDAEDIPEPDQLKKVVCAFKKTADSVCCIQAKLNYYNPDHNLLTRLFSAEYSQWFDIILPGLQSLNAPIPLGGTSNHFKTSTLRQLQFWDSFNVTEDCDLGIRLSRHGYQTAIIDSTTMEEANSSLLNWFNQRTRWLKGYIQTYFVHMRNPVAYARRSPWSFLLFQVTVGGKLFTSMINPILWAVFIAYFLYRPIIGSAIEALFPGPVFYAAVTSFVAGNFLYFYSFMMGVVKRRQFHLVKYCLFIPIYWLLISFAGWVASYRFLKNPHYWYKTIHGFHLDPLIYYPRYAF